MLIQLITGNKIVTLELDCGRYAKEGLIAQVSSSKKMQVSLHIAFFLEILTILSAQFKYKYKLTSKVG